MNEELVIAKALKIALNLTGAKHTWLRIEQNNIFIDQTLYDTFVTVLRFIKSSAARNIRTDDLKFIYANELERKR